MRVSGMLGGGGRADGLGSCSGYLPLLLLLLWPTVVFLLLLPLAAVLLLGGQSQAAAASAAVFVFLLRCFASTVTQDELESNESDSDVVDELPAVRPAGSRHAAAVFAAAAVGRRSAGSGSAHPSPVTGQPRLTASCWMHVCVHARTAQHKGSVEEPTVCQRGGLRRVE